MQLYYLPIFQIQLVPHATNRDMLLYRKSSLWGCYYSRHVTKWDVSLFIDSKILDFEMAKFDFYVVVLLHSVAFFSLFFTIIPRYFLWHMGW